MTRRLLHAFLGMCLLASTEVAASSFASRAELELGPSASNDDFIIASGGTLTENVGVNDSDPENDPLTFSSLSTTTHGLLVFNSDGSFTYTPNNGYTGADQFTYQACDPSSLCETATVNITVFAVGNSVCGTPGNDGPVNASTTVNTYFPASANGTLAAGSTSVVLGAVPATDAYGNSFGAVLISSGDLLLFVQIQDALVNTSNTAAYGSGDATSGPDGAGGTGYTSINSAGLFEYVIATSSVPLTGGTLTFRGGGPGNGLIHAYTRAPGGAGIGQRSYQIIRVPQYSNLSLTSNITCPPWNGRTGGIIAFDVAGTFSFNGRTISALGKGFRAGYQDIAGSGANVRDLWATPTYDQASGKGEGLAGTPRYMWDGYNAVDNGASWSGFPGDDFGKGAPANAGGGGNDHNSGGGGGGNGGFGGEGGIGWEGGGGNWPNGGRPGYRMPQALGKIYMGGGGGGGDANNALTGVKGGVGGGMVLINAGSLAGTGVIDAGGANGDVGAYGGAPDGAGGGGAGGSIILNVTNASPTANLTLSATGGSGGNTLNDAGFEHGPGGGGGGGVICYNATGATITAAVSGGSSGHSDGGNGIVHGSSSGQPGLARSFTVTELPSHLQGQSSTCFPTLTVNKVTTETLPVPVGDVATYTITITNSGSGGSAGGVQVRDPLPTDLTFASATVAYSGNAAGPATLTNLGTATVPLLGTFNVPSAGVVTITLNATVATTATFGTVHNGAQAYYLDPTRTTADPSRLIGPATFSITGNTTYEGGGTVPGTNYNGLPAGPAGENVLITVGPIAVDDAGNVNEDAPLNGNLGTNDSDPDDSNASLTWSLLAGGSADANGTVTVNANGTFSFVPDANYNGTVSFTYSVCDDVALCDQGQVTITVQPVNDAPVGNNDTYSTNEDATLAGQNMGANDNDIDNTSAQLVFALVSGGTAAANGTLVLNANGSFTYTPNANFSGAVSFTYSVCDPASLCDNTNTVTITVIALNDAPVANDDAFSVNEDATLTAQNLTGNDSDIDDPNVQLTWSLLSGGTAATNGALTVNANGTFNYTPNANFNGTVSFTYQVCDPSAACDPATVTITVNPVNDAPIGVNDSFTMVEGGTLNTSAGANDSDIDHTNAQLTWSLVSGGSATANGTLTFNANGTFTYAPNAFFNGLVSFTYAVCDPAPLCDNTNTVTIDVGSVNDPPLAVDDGFTMNEDAVLSNTVAGNDSDPDGDALSFGLVSGGTAAGNGTLVFNANGTFTFTPNANYNGSVSFTYQACDPSTVCDQALVTIVVSPVNDTPIANDDPFTTSEDVALIAQNVAGNDSDPDNTNAQLTWSLLSGGTAATNGTLTFNANGTFAWTPNPNYTGSVSFTYQACDPSSACDPATVTIVVTPVNDAPTANDDGFTVAEDAALTAQSVSGNDNDIDNTNAQLTWSLVGGGTAAANGTLVFNANGTFAYTPNANYNGTVSFTYQACDPSSACDPATVTITVTPGNDAPVGTDDTFTMNEDATLSNSVATNDADIDNTGAQLTCSIVSGGTAAANGTINLSANGSFTYTPAADFNGTVSFTYRVCDPSAACDPATVTITVNPVNDAPLANDDSFSMSEDGTLSNSTGGNDSDPESLNSVLVWSLLSGGTAAAHGTLSLNANGTFTFTPTANYNGTVAFTYQVCDPSNLCDQATVTIVINAVNDAPVANDDAFTMNEDAVLSNTLGTNDSDTETPNAGLTWSVLSTGTAGANGTVSVNTNGTFSYTPAANFNGTVSFTYQLCDPGAACDPATVTITVNGVNDAPIANDDGFSMAEDGTLSGSLSGNDSDPDHANGVLTWSLSNGGTAAANGTLTVNANGTFSYVPTPGSNGLVSFVYTLCDPLSACDNATVTIDVGSVNDPPTANDDGFSISEDGTLTGTVVGNDADPDGDVLTTSLTNGGTAAANGTLVLNTNGSFTYTPNANFNGTVNFTYQVCDPSSVCDAATVTIAVTPVNDAPVANDDAFSTNEETLLTASVTANDGDVDGGGLSWSLVNGGSAAANGTLNLSIPGTFTYTPNANFNGTVSFTYQVCDASNACDPAVVTITVAPVNDIPVAGDDVFTMNEDATLNATVTANDNDVESPNAALTWSLVSGGTAAANGSLTLQANGTFTYVPTADFNGSVSFTYQVCDPSSACDPATVTITVNPVNDAPLANDDTFNASEDVPLTASVAGNDSDPETANSSLTWSLVSGGSAAANGTLVLGANGGFTYTPTLNFNGTVTFTYQVCDPTNACDQATATIVVAPGNDAPNAVDDALLTNEDVTLNASVAGNDNDIDNTNGQLTWSLVSGGTAATNGSFVFNADGTFSFTPNANFNGSVSFTYQVCDPGTACDQATVTITVVPVNDAPVANDDGFSLNEDGSLNTGVSGNDGDTESPNGVLTWSLVNGGSAAANGTLSFNADGTFVFTPNANYNGTVGFTYQVCDPGNACDPATVTITVAPVNDAPVASDDGYGTTEDGTLSNSVTGNDSDVDDAMGQLVWSVVDGGTAATNGTLLFNSDGSFTYTPSPGFNGIVSFTYQVCDPAAQCDQAIVTIDVGSENDTPIAMDDAFSLNEDGSLVNAAGANDSDPDGDVLTWSLVSGGSAAANGTLVFNADGSFTYTPNTNYNGTASFTYQACDPFSFCDNAVVTLNVNAVNDAPVANDDAFTVAEDGTLTNALSSNDSDVDGAMTWSLVNGGSAAANGTLTVNAGGTFTFVPTTNFNGTVSFTYQACDASNACDPATVTIVVTPVNDAPVANDDAFTMNEDGILNNSAAANDNDPESPNSALSWSLVNGGSAAAHGTLSMNANGTFTYTPNANFNGAVSFTYQVCDPANACDPATVTITVNPVNDAPQANDDAFTTTEGTPVSGDLGVNDIDPDGDALNWALVDGATAAAHGNLVVNANGTFTFTPAAGFNGTVGFSYQACDPINACDLAFVTIAVGAVNDPPVVVGDLVTTQEETSVVINVLSNDSDSDGSLVGSSVTIINPPTNGTATVNVDGTITYQPGPNFFGTEGFIYQVCDNGTPLPPQCGSALVLIDVQPTNDAPVPGDDGFTLVEDGDIIGADLTGNDFDPDNTNAELTWSLVNGGSAAANGTLVFNANGTFSYTPHPNFYGFVTFTYSTCDPGGACDQATVFLTVLPVNDPPVALGDEENTLPNYAITSNIIANDNDTTDGSPIDPASVTIIQAPDSGSVVVNSNGTVTYTPNPGFIGNDTLIYQVCDMGVPLPALCNTAILVIEVTQAYPLAIDDFIATDEDSTITIDVLENDSTANGVIVPSTVTILGGPYNGSAAVNPDGTITYVPDPDFNGSDVLIYTVCTDLGFCSNAAVTIGVTPVNDPPTALGDTATTNEEVAVTINAIANDDDPLDAPQGGIDATSVNVVVQPANGTAVANADGTITYTPNIDFNGTDSLLYAVCDLGEPLPSECDTAQVIIIVGPVNDGPVITDGGGTPIDTLQVSTNEDVPATICFNATDPEGDPLDVTNAFLGPQFGTISQLNDGDTCLLYIPQTNYNGGDTVTIVVCDDHGACDTLVVVIDVLPVNDPPQVIDPLGGLADTLFVATGEDQPVTLCMDVLDVEGDSVQVSAVLNGPANGSVSGLADADTCFTYAPDPNFNGSDAVQVIVCDNAGGCDTVWVVIAVAPANDPPVITDSGGSSIDTLSVFTTEEVPVTICLNAVDIDGDSLDVVSVPYGPFNGGASGTLDGDTCFLYTPDPGFQGTDSLLAVVCDDFGGCDTVLVIVHVLERNDPPVITDGGGQPIDTLLVSTPEDNPVTICLNAIDPEGMALDASTAFGGPLNGSLAGLNDGDTCVLYTPFPNFNGTDSVYIVVCDPLNACDTVLVLVNVTPVNDPPVIVDPGFVPIDTVYASTGGGTPVTICLDAYDPDGDPLDVTDILAGPQNGLADTYNDGDTCFTYTPDPGFLGTDVFTAVVCDGNGGCDSVVVIIDVTAPNQPPIIVDSTFASTDTLVFTTNEDQPLGICLTVIDLDGDSVDVTSVYGGPLNGSVNGIADGDTCFAYAPFPNFNGNDTLHVVVCDDNGGCDSVLVIIQVLPVNDPPVIVDAGFVPIDTTTATTTMDAPITICLNALDVDGDALDVSSITAGPANGTISALADGDTCFVYTPNTGYLGNDTLIAYVCDGNGGCDSVIVIISVTPLNPNTPPIIVDENSAPVDTLDFTTLQNDPITICLSVVDLDGDPVDVTGTFGGPVNGSISGTSDGDTCFTYTPNTGFSGNDTLHVVVCDDNGGCDSVVVIITVTPVTTNDPPIAVDDDATTAVNTSVMIDVLVNDSDPNGDPITVTSAGAANGTVVINGDGSITYTPPNGFCGNDTITYTICDPGPLCDVGIVVVNVPCPPINDPPIAVDDSASTEPNTGVIIHVLNNDSDPNGDPLTVTNADAHNGTVVINADGTLSYMPDNGFCGVDTISYTVCDPQPLCDEAIVLVTVECPDTSGLAIPQGFSPNNDGHGDRWEIRGLEKYPLASVLLFNRWGNEVYSAAPYMNDWDGRSTNGLTWDGVLPVGTYWYVLDLHVEGEEPRTGYVYLNK